MTAEKRYYFDANALFKGYTEEVGSTLIKRFISDSSLPIFVSELTLLECFSVAMKEKRAGNFKLKRTRSIYEALKKIAHAHSPHFELVFMPEEIFKVAHEILLTYAKTYDIGSHDALHLAIVKNLEFSAVMVTSDNSLCIVCQQMKVEFYNPESESGMLS
jgi:predicted nucleic acid-binding protein